MISFSERLNAESDFRLWCAKHGAEESPKNVLAWLETSGKKYLEMMGQ